MRYIQDRPEQSIQNVYPCIGELMLSPPLFHSVSRSLHLSQAHASIVPGIALISSHGSDNPCRFCSPCCPIPSHGALVSVLADETIMFSWIILRAMERRHSVIRTSPVYFIFRIRAVLVRPVTRMKACTRWRSIYICQRSSLIAVVVIRLTP